jgi:hypothetical protein
MDDRTQAAPGRLSAEDLAVWLETDGWRGDEQDLVLAQRYEAAAAAIRAGSACRRPSCGERVARTVAILCLAVPPFAILTGEHGYVITPAMVLVLAALAVHATWRRQ